MVISINVMSHYTGLCWSHHFVIPACRLARLCLMTTGPICVCCVHSTEVSTQLYSMWCSPEPIPPPLRTHDTATSFYQNVLSYLLSLSLCPSLASPSCTLLSFVMELLKNSVAMQEQILACKGFLVIGHTLEKVRITSGSVVRPNVS